MIKLIIFDLDGVLVDARELHYEALNRALASIDEKYVIKRDEHLSTYDGLPTTKKLNMLTKNKGLPKEKHDLVWKKKQEMTIQIIDEEMTYDDRLRNIVKRFRSEKYIISVASNSIRESCKMMLLRKGFLEYVDFFYCGLLSDFCFFIILFCHFSLIYSLYIFFVSTDPYYFKL